MSKEYTDVVSETVHISNKEKKKTLGAEKRVDDASQIRTNMGYEFFWNGTSYEYVIVEE